MTIRKIREEALARLSMVNTVELAAAATQHIGDGAALCDAVDWLGTLLFDQDMPAKFKKSVMAKEKMAELYKLVPQPKAPKVICMVIESESAEEDGKVAKSEIGKRGTVLLAVKGNNKDALKQYAEDRDIEDSEDAVVIKFSADSVLVTPEWLTKLQTKLQSEDVLAAMKTGMKHVQRAYSNIISCNADWLQAVVVDFDEISKPAFVETL